MPGKVQGITVEIGGDTSKLTKSLKGVNSEIRGTEKELKAVERLLKLDPKNTELLAQKQKLLGNELDITKKKLEALKKAKQDADKKMKDGGNVDQEMYRKLQREIVATEQKVKSLTAATSKFTAVGESLQGVGDKMTSIGQKGMALTGVITGVAAGLVAATEENRDYREDMSRLEAAFVSAGKTAESAKNAYHDFYLILGEEDRSVEAVNHLAKLCDSEQELSQWSTICAGVSATFGDSLPIEGLTEAANETAKVAKVTGPLADALNWVGISEDGFNVALEKCNSEKERSILITNTLETAYRNAANEFTTMNADVMASREVTQRLNDEIATLSAKIEPIITSVKAKIADMLKWFNNLTAGQQKIVVGIAAIAAAVPPLLILAGKVVTAVGAITKAFGASKLATVGFSGALKSLWAVITAHPIGALITAITALTAGIIAVAYASDETAQEISRLCDESNNLSKETKQLISETDNAESSIAAEQSTIDGLIDRLYNLEGQTNKTAAEKAEMQSIVDQLNALIPNLNLNINSETGLLNIQRSTVQGLANDYINLAYAKAYAQQLEIAVSKKIELEKNSTEIRTQINDLPKREDRSWFDNALNLTVAKGDKLNDKLYKNEQSIKALDAEISEYSSKIAEHQGKINTATGSGGGGSSLDSLRKQYAALGASAGKAGKSAKKAADTTKKSVEKVEDAEKKAAEAAKKAFSEEYDSLKNALSLGQITEEEYYAKLAGLREKYLKGDKSEYEKYTVEIRQGLRDKDFRNLKFSLDMGYITEEEYYQTLTEMRDGYFVEGSKEWQDYTVEINNYHKKVAEEAEQKAEEATNKIKEKIESIFSDYSQRISEAQSKQDSFTDSLKSAHQLVDSKDINGKTGYNLHDWTQDSKDIKEYKKSLETIEDKVKPLLGDRFEEFYNTVLSGSQIEGRVIAEEISHMSDTRLKEYLQSWEEYQSEAEDISEGIYASEVYALRNGYFNKILDTADEMSAEFTESGKKLADFFGTGFLDSLSEILSGIGDTLSSAFGKVLLRPAGSYNSVDNSKTNNINVNVSSGGGVWNENTIGRKISNILWLGSVL